MFSFIFVDLVVQTYFVDYTLISFSFTYLDII